MVSDSVAKIGAAAAELVDAVRKVGRRESAAIRN
jgi:hypothetical protein